MHGVRGEMCWGVEGGEGSCGKSVGVWGEVRKDVWGVEKCGGCGRVYRKTG